MLQPGQSYAVPATATAPLLKTGKPEALRITVGTCGRAAGRAGRDDVNDVSLLAADLLKTGRRSARRRRRQPPRRAGSTAALDPAVATTGDRSGTAPPPASGPATAPPTNTTGE